LWPPRRDGQYSGALFHTENLVIMCNWPLA